MSPATLTHQFFFISFYVVLYIAFYLLDVIACLLPGRMCLKWRRLSVILTFFSTMVFVLICFVPNFQSYIRQISVRKLFHYTSSRTSLDHIHAPRHIHQYHPDFVASLPRVNFQDTTTPESNITRQILIAMLTALRSP